MQSYLEPLLTNFRFADLLDIIVIAVLLYCAISWFRQRASRSLALGLTLVVGLFLCARWLDMYLTATLFQAGLTAVLFALIVVFQQDLRRAFERLAASGFFGRAPKPDPSEGIIDTLVESIAALAENRTGALLVFEGREPLARLTRGGVAVDGRISLPLLHSIFDSHSPGHDGAVLINGEWIEQLGVHLPLSKNLAEIGPRGTRHAAALGLAESCDALVLVVSEERGTISVARHSRLIQIEPPELTSRLELYYQERSETAAKPPWYRSATRGIGLKLAALGIACLLWLLFAYRVETVQKTFVVPIEYRNLAENWAIDEPRPTRAELTLTGSERTIESLDASKLAVSFDLQHVQSQTAYALRTKDNVKGLPANLNVDQIRPSEVTITVAKKTAPDN